MTSKENKQSENTEPKTSELNEEQLDKVQGGLKMTDTSGSGQGFTATDDLWVKGEGKGFTATDDLWVKDEKQPEGKNVSGLGLGSGRVK